MPLEYENNNFELLDSLKIKDEDSSDSVLSRSWLVPIAVVACIVLSTFFLIFYSTNQNASMNAEFVDEDKSSQTIDEIDEKVSKVDDQTTKLEGIYNPEILNASGYVIARESATVSAEVMGRIEQVYVEEGVRVEKGQIIAEINSVVATLDLQLAEANVEATKQRLLAIKAEYDEALRVSQRLKLLEDEQFASEAEITRAHLDVSKLDSEIKALFADLHVLRLSADREKEFLEKYKVRAPFSGVVTARSAQSGEIIAPSAAGGGFTRTGICTIVNMDSLEVEVDVNEAYIGRVFKNQKVIVKLDAYPGWEIPAKVIAIIPTANRSKATVQVRIDLLLEDSRILPNMGVKVAFYGDDLEGGNNDVSRNL